MYVAATLAAAGIASTATAAVTPPTGDIAAIDFLRVKSNAFAGLAGAKIVQTGYFFVRPGKGKSVDYLWGRRPPAGYKPATATILARLADGKVSAYLAEFRAPGVRTLRVLMAGGTVYASTTRCWRKSWSGASPLGTGDSYVFNYGGARFLPLSRSGGKTAVTFTYKWVPGARARETSTFGSGKPLAFDVTIRVTGTQNLTIRKSVTPLAKTPALPVPLPPGLPVPKPLCTPQN
jgi:hypothetical protein